MIPRIILGIFLVLISMISGIWLERYNYVDSLPFANSLISFLEKRLYLPVSQDVNNSISTNTLPKIKLFEESLIMENFEVKVKRPPNWIIFFSPDTFEIYTGGTVPFIEGERERTDPVLRGSIEKLEEGISTDEYINKRKQRLGNPVSEVLINVEGEEVLLYSNGQNYTFIIPFKNKNDEVYLITINYDFTKYDLERSNVLEFIQNLEIKDLE